MKPHAVILHKLALEQDVICLAYSIWSRQTEWLGFLTWLVQHVEKGFEKGKMRVDSRITLDDFARTVGKRYKRVDLTDEQEVRNFTSPLNVIIVEKIFRAGIYYFLVDRHMRCLYNPSGVDYQSCSRSKRVLVLTPQGESR